MKMHIRFRNISVLRTTGGALSGQRLSASTPIKLWKTKQRHERSGKPVTHTVNSWTSTTSTQSLSVSLCSSLTFPASGHMFLTSTLTPTFQPHGTYCRKDEVEVFRGSVTLKHGPFCMIHSVVVAVYCGCCVCLLVFFSLQI